MSSKKVIVGVTASYDSIAAVLLLKLQNFDLIAIHVVIDQGDEAGKSINTQETQCLMKDDKKILEKIFTELAIPLYFVDRKENFYETVISNGVLANFMKEFHAPCLQCHKMKIITLYEKMEKLQADFIATGHYAKLRKAGQEGLVSLYQNTIKELDQHKLLAGVDQTILSKLLLPLSDLSRQKVISIVQEHLPKQHHYLSQGTNHAFCPIIKDPSQSVKKQIPASMNKKSRLFLRDNKTFLNESYDNTEFEFGEIFKLGFSHKGKEQLLAVTGFNYSYQTIYVNEQPAKGINYIFVQIYEFFGKPNLSWPTSCLVSFNDDEATIEAEMYIKGLNYAIIHLQSSDYHYVPSKSVVYICEDTKQGQKLSFLAKVVSQGKLDGATMNAHFALAKLDGDYPF